MSGDSDCSYSYSQPENELTEDIDGLGLGIRAASNRQVGRNTGDIRRSRSSSRDSYGSEEEENSGGKRERARKRSYSSEESFEGEEETEGTNACGKRRRVGGVYDTECRGERMDISGHSSCAVDRCDNASQSTEGTDIYGIRGLASDEYTREENYIRDTARNYKYVKTHETARSRLFTVLTDGFRQNPSRRRIVHDVYETLRSWGDSAVDCRVLREKFTGTILIVASHDDHYHIVHDCAYSNSTCRCAFINYLSGGNRKDGPRHATHSGIIGRRYSRRVVPNFDVCIDHWINLSKYFEKGSRQINYLDFAGRTWIPSGEVGCLRFLEDIRHAEVGVVEKEHLSFDFPDFINCGSEIYNGATPAGSSSIGHSQDRGSQEGGKGDRLVRFLQERPTSPVTHIFNTSMWLKSKYKFYDLNSVFIKNCVRIVNNSYNELSIVDLYEHFKRLEPQHLIFNAPLAATDSYYYTIDESVDVLNRLLLFQFDRSTEHILKFLRELVAVIDRLVPKKNTLYVLSPPNAGKNYFFDCCLHYCINFGQMGNFNRYCNFPMMECVDRRIILWNEPCMEPSAVETLKMILGGDTVNAKVKYQGDAVITRTPVIVLSNNDIFPNDSAFRSRIFQYRWKACDFLKDCKKKPHPLAFYHLLSLYKVL